MAEEVYLNRTCLRSEAWREINEDKIELTNNLENKTSKAYLQSFSKQVRVTMSHKNRFGNILIHLLTHLLTLYQLFPVIKLILQQTSDIYFLYDSVR